MRKEVQPWLSSTALVSHINKGINTASWESLRSSPSQFSILYIKYALQHRASFMSATQMIDFIPIKIPLGFFHFSFYASCPTFLRDCQLTLGSKVSLKKNPLFCSHHVYFVHNSFKTPGFCTLLSETSYQIRCILSYNSPACISKEIGLALTSKSLSVIILVSLPTPFDSVMLHNPERYYSTHFSRRNHYGVICK